MCETEQASKNLAVTYVQAEQESKILVLVPSVEVEQESEILVSIPCRKAEQESEIFVVAYEQAEQASDSLVFIIYL